MKNILKNLKVNRYESICVKMFDGVYYLYDTPSKELNIGNTNSNNSFVTVVNMDMDNFISMNLDAIKEISIVDDGVQIFKVILRP